MSGTAKSRLLATCLEDLLGTPEHIMLDSEGSRDHFPAVSSCSHVRVHKEMCLFQHHNCLQNGMGCRQRSLFHKHG